MKETMLSYIKDQPRMLRYIFESRDLFVKKWLTIFKNNSFKKIVLIGAGTSDYVSRAFKYYVDKYIDIDSISVLPTTYTYYCQEAKSSLYNNSNVLVLGFSQTGTSINTVKAIKKAKQLGFTTAVLTAVSNSEICDYSDYVIPLLCGTENVPPETRGFTSAVLTSYLMVISLALELESITAEQYQNKINEIDLFLDHVDECIAQSEEWFYKNKIELMQMKKGAVTGYGINYITALEGDMKLAETFRQPIVAYEMEEFIHGPNMAYGKDHYIFLLLSDEHERERANDILHFFEPVTNHIFVITNESGNYNGKDLRFVYRAPIDLTIIQYVIPLQLYAALACVEAGIDTSVFPFDNNGIAHDD